VSYEVYQRPAAQDDAPPPTADEPWHVVLEYSNRGDAKPPTKLVVRPYKYDDRDSAYTAAEHQAFDFAPPDPFSPQGREVYRDGPDGFLIVIQGAMSTFHFSSRIVQFVGKR